MKGSPRSRVIAVALILATSLAACQVRTRPVQPKGQNGGSGQSGGQSGSNAFVTPSIPPGTTVLAFPAKGVLPPQRDVEPLCKCKADRQYFHDFAPPAIPMPEGLDARCPGVFTDTTPRMIITEMQIPSREPLAVTTRTVAYQGPGGVTIPAFVSRPDNDKPYPVVIYVHGGLGEPALDEPGAKIATAGFVVITPGYRGTAYEGMAPTEATTMADPGHLDTKDVLAGWKWVLGHERTTGKTILMGSSLGGAIVNELAYQYPDNWSGVVDFFGITDWACVMKFVSYGQSSAWVIGRAFGGTPEDVPEEYIKYSPIYHAAEVKAPFYIAQGLQDTTFPPGESEKWADALIANGVDVTFLPYAGETHGFVLEEPFESPVWQDVFNWMDEQLR